MTEPIMINDIDVSGCGYLLSPKEPECIIQGLGTNETINCCNCKDNPNCYYKQLKRKEQECEKYKKCIDDIKIINKDLLKGICDNCGWHNTDGCNPEDFVCGELIKIKQKINEVENER